MQKSVYKIKSDVILAFCQTTVGVSNLFHYKSRAKFFQEKVTVSIGIETVIHTLRNVVVNKATFPSTERGKVLLGYP